MFSQTQTHPTLVIPQGMNRLRLHQSDAIQGGKRREGAFLNRAVFGMLAGMIVPGGFIVAFL